MRSFNSNKCRGKLKVMCTLYNITHEIHTVICFSVCTVLSTSLWNSYGKYLGVFTIFVRQGNIHKTLMYINWVLNVRKLSQVTDKSTIYKWYLETLSFINSLALPISIERNLCSLDENRLLTIIRWWFVFSFGGFVMLAGVSLRLVSSSNEFSRDRKFADGVFMVTV